MLAKTNDWLPWPPNAPTFSTLGSACRTAETARRCCAMESNEMSCGPITTPNTKPLSWLGMNPVGHRKIVKPLLVNQTAYRRRQVFRAFGNRGNLYGFRSRAHVEAQIFLYLVAYSQSQLGQNEFLETHLLCRDGIIAGQQRYKCISARRTRHHRLGDAGVDSHRGNFCIGH